MTFQNLDTARRFLRDVDAPLTAALLRHAEYSVVVREGWLGEDELYVEIHAPPAFTKALQSLPDFEKQRILNAIADQDTRIPTWGLGADRLLLNDIPDSNVTPRDELIAELVCQRDMLIDVATGGARFNDVNDYYKRRRKRIYAALAPLSQQDPSPFDDLWDWHKYWIDQGWTTYAERRQYIGDLYGPVIHELLGASEESLPVPREPTGWERVDRALKKARGALEAGAAEEDFQLIGLLCREALISLGQSVYDPAVHAMSDEPPPSTTDAKRMLEAFITAAVPGESNETIRRHARASLSLAVELQHRRTATFRQAALCLEATESTVNVVAIMEGRRDRATE